MVGFTLELIKTGFRSDYWGKITEKKKELCSAKPPGQNLFQSLLSKMTAEDDIEAYLEMFKQT